MAEAKKTEQTKVEKTFTLTLTEDEAAALYTATGSIGGSIHGPRKHTSDVHYALMDAGASDKYSKHRTGSMTFHQDPQRLY